MERPNRTMPSLYKAARRYKTAVAAIDHTGPVIRDLISLVWLYRHGDRSENLHRQLDDIVKRSRAYVRDTKGIE